MFFFYLKGLRHQCKSTSDCEDNMVCEIEGKNDTIKGVILKFDTNSKVKMCLCDKENGYMEKHDLCSGVGKFLTFNSMFTLCMTFTICKYILGVH